MSIRSSWINLQGASFLRKDMPVRWYDHPHPQLRLLDSINNSQDRTGTSGNVLIIEYSTGEQLGNKLSKDDEQLNTSQTHSESTIEAVQLSRTREHNTMWGLWVHVSSRDRHHLDQARVVRGGVKYLVSAQVHVG